MDSSEVIRFLLWLHGATLAGLGTAYYYFRNYSNSIYDIKQDPNNSFDNIKRKLAIDLGTKLKLIYKSSAATNIIKGPDGEDFKDMPVDPSGGEEYKNILYGFIFEKNPTLVDLRNLNNALSQWKFFFKFRAIGLIIAFVIAFIFFILIVLHHLDIFKYNYKFLKYSWGLDIFFISILFFVPSLCIQCYEHYITDIRNKYE